MRVFFPEKTVSKTSLTLQDFCRATDQIGYDMKRRVIADYRGI